MKSTKPREIGPAGVLILHYAHGEADALRDLEREREQHARSVALLRGRRRRTQRGARC